DAKQVQPPAIGPDGQPIVAPPAGAATPFVQSGPTAPGAQPHQQHGGNPFRPAGGAPYNKPGVRPGAPTHGPSLRDDGGEEGATPEGDTDDDDFENALSLAAIEAELKPKVLETFDTVADSYKRLRRLQEQDIANKLTSASSASLSPAQERKYKKL